MGISERVDLDGDLRKSRLNGYLRKNRLDGYLRKSRLGWGSQKE